MAWVHNHYEKFSGKSEFNYHWIADLQLGSTATREDRIKRKIDEILADPRSRWGVLGDIEDDDRPTTRGRKKQTFGDRPEVLSNAARDHLAWLDSKVIPLLKPLTARPCLGILAGHHYTDINRDWNSVQYIANRLTKAGGFPVPYLGIMSAWIWLRFHSSTAKTKKVTRLLHVQHGVGGSQATGSALKKLEVARASFYADAYVRAHDCRIEACKVDTLRPKDTDDEPSILSRTTPLLNIGSATMGYLPTKGEPAYPEQSMMKPNSIGWGILKAQIRKAYQDEDPAQNLMVEWKVEI